MTVGINRIEHVSGKLLRSGISDRYLLVAAGSKHCFQVTDWQEDSVSGQRPRVKWQLRESRKNVVLMTCTKAGAEQLVFEISKKLSGLELFRLEATIDRNAHIGHPVGMYLRGYTRAVITKAFWAKAKGGEPYQGILKYGEHICLHAETEGLNGAFCSFEVYHSEAGKADLLVASYNDVRCVNGALNLEIKDTHNWYLPMLQGPDVADFLVKIRESSSFEVYYADVKGSVLHASYLKIQKKLKVEIEKPGNLVPVKA